MVSDAYAANKTAYYPSLVAVVDPFKQVISSGPIMELYN